ncbi:MAG: efflux transporter outer membrane subunit [Pseudomonadota bacterium]
MNKHPSLKIWCGALLGAAAGGCSLTPVPITPDIVSEIQASDQFSAKTAVSVAPTQTMAWWVDVGGQELDGLVQQLLSQSLVLEEVRLQAEQAQEVARITRGQRLPSVVAIGDVSTSRSPDFQGDFSWSESYSAGALLDFNTDIFGGLRASERAADLNAIAADLAIQSAEQREIAVLARNWVSAATLQRRLDLAKRTADSFQTTYELTNQRYSAGSASVSASDVQIALQNLETALIDIPQIETDLTRQFLVLDEQLAISPGNSQSSFRGDFITTTPFTPAAGSPAQLLSNRPDVASAELRYRAALEDIGAARANLYPALSLSASLTFQADEPGDLFDVDRYISSLASSLTAPVFQGGRLRAQVRLEEAQAGELATAFARTALAAVVDVELALADLSGLEQQRERSVAALETARISNDLAQGRYEQGLTSILSVLETQRSLNASEQTLILTDQAIANARIDLFLSLGGDWFGSTQPSRADGDTLDPGANS